MNNDEMKCTDFEVLLADYLDETLSEEQRLSVESHIAGCPACAELTRDASQAISLLSDVPEIDPPPFLVNRILRATTNRPKLDFAALLSPKNIFARVLQPRFAMGMAMAALSLVMVGRFWDSAENVAFRAWNRTMKRYENMAVVYDVQSQIDEWRAQAAGGPGK